MRILYYINQFFAQIGGENSAYFPIEFREELVGPGNVLNSMLNNSEIVVTSICGDNYYVENEDAVIKKIAEAIEKYNVDLVIAGPAFNAGRYGIACGSVCKIAFDHQKIAVSALYEQNPGLDIYRKYAYIFPTERQARDMINALKKIATFVNKISKGNSIGLPEEEGYYRRGIRRNIFREKTGAERAVDMALAKVLNRPFKTEVPMPKFEKIIPSRPVKDLSKVKVALITSGGIVPKGNPDHLESLNSSKWVLYNEESFGGNYNKMNAEVVHGGYDPAYGNKNANRVLPADAMNELEKRNVIGEFYENVIVTVGNSMDIQRATKFGKEISQKLLSEGVQAVLITSTWGTDTRCGATLAKQIDKEGIPVVHLCTIVPISEAIGANRIYAGLGIPHPCANIMGTSEEEFDSRISLIENALKTLTIEVEEPTIFGRCLKW